jgi:hypothetical protein
MKGMGSYTRVEKELSNFSADEMNELFLSGGLDKIYEDFERDNKDVIGFGAGIVITDAEIEAFDDYEEDDEITREEGYSIETIQQ